MPGRRQRAGQPHVGAHRDDAGGERRLEHVARQAGVLADRDPGVATGLAQPRGDRHAEPHHRRRWSSARGSRRRACRRCRTVSDRYSSGDVRSTTRAVQAPVGLARAGAGEVGGRPGDDAHLTAGVIGVTLTRSGEIRTPIPGGRPSSSTVSLARPCRLARQLDDRRHRALGLLDREQRAGQRDLDLRRDDLPAGRIDALPVDPHHEPREPRVTSSSSIWTWTLICSLPTSSTPSGGTRNVGVEKLSVRPSRLTSRVRTDDSAASRRSAPRTCTRRRRRLDLEHDVAVQRPPGRRSARHRRASRPACRTRRASSAG